MALDHLSMGRYKLPAEVKEKRGTSRKCREEQSGGWDAIVTLESVKVPKDIKGEAAKIYKERVQMLFAMGILQHIDVDALRLYSNAVASAIKLQAAIDKEGYTVIERDEDGNLCKVSVNPLVKVLKDAVNTANTIGSQFGWSPLARMRLQAMANPKKETDNFSEFD